MKQAAITLNKECPQKFAKKIVSPMKTVDGMM